VNIKDYLGGQTPLHLAALNGHEEICHMIIAKSDDVNLKNSWGQTALHLATEKGLDTVCSAILDKTEDKNPKDNLDNTPLHIAAKAGNMVLVKRILMKSGESSNFVHIKFGAYSMVSIKSRSDKEYITFSMWSKKILNYTTYNRVLLEFY
jgi:ankyrin repeat protein